MHLISLIKYFSYFHYDVISSLFNYITVKGLVRDWAPLVWLAPGELFLPLGVPEFLDNMQSDVEYLHTKIDVGK